MNNYYVIDLIHHRNNHKLQDLYRQNLEVFTYSESLFSSLPEKNQKDVSPILCRVEQFNDDFLNELLLDKKESVLALYSSLSLSLLSTHLQKYMEFKLADGNTGLIRFYDPRVFRTFNNMLKPMQKEHFWKGIFFVRGWDDINNDYYIEEFITNV